MAKNDNEIENNTNTQVLNKTLRGGTPINTDAQFGKPNGNKQGRGFWKKEDTARYKLEQMMKLNESELFKIAKDKDAPLFERKLAIAINKGDWKDIEHMINQVYGFPKQTVEQTNLEPPAPRISSGKKNK